MTLEEYDVIILDCDGVIFDSNLLKVEAFKRALSKYDNSIVELFSEYFKNNFGTSRYRLAKVFIERFLNQKYNEELYQEILKNYASNCLVLYREVDFTNNLIDFLIRYKHKSLYVASGGDEVELNEVFKIKKINKYFKKILGSPRKKSDLVCSIVNNHSKEKIIMIGDAKSDFIASKENNIEFIFMNKYSLVQTEMQKLSKEYGFSITTDLRGVINE